MRHRPRRRASRPPWKSEPTEPTEAARPYTLHPDCPPVFLTDEAAAVVADCLQEASELFRLSALLDTPPGNAPVFTKGYLTDEN
jgi:hypothetical protein